MKIGLKIPRVLHFISQYCCNFDLEIRKEALKKKEKKEEKKILSGFETTVHSLHIS